MRRLLVASSIALVLLGCASWAEAGPVNPGDSGVLPTLFTAGSTSVTLLGDSGVQSFNLASGVVTGSYEIFEIIDPFNVYCSTCIDLAFLVENSSPAASLLGVTLQVGELATDVPVAGKMATSGYLTDFGPGGLVPATVGRGPHGHSARSDSIGSRLAACRAG
jgi:hypothetical protein